MSKCVTCERVQGPPFKAQPHEPLPKERINESRPFSVSGLEYTIPLNVKTDAGAVDKVYIVLFTCAATRAIHLEIAENCSETEFLNAFRRFVARRSVPSIIISDNASTFEAANKTLDQLYNDDGETNRPITKLYPLEVASEMDEYTSVPPCTSSNRPSREAAIEARSKIRRCL